MKKEFIPYELALELKKLGFDEPCFGFYDESLYFPNNENQYGTFCNQPLDVPSCSAPLYQQAFRWFREKYDIHYSINRECSQHDHKWGYNWSMYNYTGIFDEYLTSHPDAPAGEWIYNTYEEAELACLKKLIEIVKQLKKD
jgi:hypothetical protein